MTMKGVKMIKERGGFLLLGSHQPHYVALNCVVKTTQPLDLLLEEKQ